MKFCTKTQKKNGNVKIKYKINQGDKLEGERGRQNLCEKLFMTFMVKEERQGGKEQQIKTFSNENKSK